MTLNSLSIPKKVFIRTGDAQKTIVALDFENLHFERFDD
jgi:hypothetical protein